MKINNAKTIKLSKDEVMTAILSYCKIKGIDLENKDCDIDSVIKRVQIPGGGLHDCDWQETFDGITIKFKEEDEV